MEDKIEGEILAEFIASLPKIYPYEKVMMAKLKNQRIQKMCGKKRN